VIRRIRDQATYANVMATIAVFIAVGGTSYAAITLPRNSVGPTQIKSRAVGSTEIRSGAVRTRAIMNGTIQIEDLARSTRATLAGTPGPAGPPGAPAIELRAGYNPATGLVSGNATSLEGAGVGKRLLGFARSVAGCTPVASLASNPGPTFDLRLAHVVATVQGDRVLVETYNSSGAPEALPVNLIVAC
jgi:hypothetical protein